MDEVKDVTHNDSGGKIKVQTGVSMSDLAISRDTTEKEESPSPPPSSPHPPSFFTDTKGNLKLVNLVVRHPVKIFVLIMGICLITSFLLVQIVFQNGNPFADPATAYDMDDERSVAYDSLRLAKDEIESIRSSLAESNVTSVKRPQEENQDVTYWVFEAETESGIFGSKEAISGLREAETLFTQHEDFPLFCYKKYNNNVNGTDISTCHGTLSPLNMYYASSWNEDMIQNIMDQLSNDPNKITIYNHLGICIEYGIYCELVPTTLTTQDYEWARGLNANITSITSSWDGKGQLNQDIDQVTLFAAYLTKLNTKKGIVDFFYDSDFSLENPVSMYSRFIVAWGGPLDLPESFIENSNVIVMEDDTKRDMDINQLKRYIVKNFLPTMDIITAPKHNPDVNSYYFMGVLILEVLLEIVQVDAMLAIVSFSFVFFYIRLMVGSWFLAFVGMFEIFFSIPISWFLFTVVFQIEYFSFLNALCLFIVAAIGADDIFIFMDAYRHSGREDSSILTSLETRMSWVYRRTGSAMAVTSATTCSAFLCTLITPLVGVRAFGVFAALVILIDYILVMTLFCTAVVIYHNKFERPGCCSSCTNLCRSTTPSPTISAYNKQVQDGEGSQQTDRISNFFRYKMVDFLLKPMNRAVLGMLFITWIVVASVFAAKLEPTKETEQFLDEDHPLQKSFSILNTAFPTAENDIGAMIYFNWGIGRVDRSGVNQLINPDYFGKPTFLDTFNFNQQCQSEMLTACDELKTLNKYKPYIKQEGGIGSVNCFIEEFAAFSVDGNLDDCVRVRDGSWKNETWVVDPSDLPTLMNDFFQQTSCFEQNDGSNLPIADKYSTELGWDGKSLKYASISIESAIIDPFSSLSEQIVREQYDMMVVISNQLNTMMEVSCGPVIMTDLDLKFIFMNNQRIYTSSATQSAILGIAIAFTVLLVSTKILHIAALATISIGCVLLSVTGTIVMLGWDLGSIEAILISIVAGFSVDYVVHLAHAYERAEGDTTQRVRAAFGEMGISVMNGMITSVGASIPLFFCQLQFFKKFGTFLCLTIAFSWIFANLGFMTVLVQLKIPIKRKFGGFSW